MAQFDPNLWEPVEAGVPSNFRFENISEEDKQKILSEYKTLPIDISQPKAGKQFDPAKWEPVPIEEPAQVQRMRVGQGSPTVQMARGLSPMPPAPQAEAPVNQLRPRQTIGGEFMGGMKQLGQALGAPAPVGPYTPRPGTPEAANMPPRPPSLAFTPFEPFDDPRAGQAALGAARMIGAPLAPLYNANTWLGEGVRDVTAKGIPGMGSKVPGTNTTPADALGHVAAFASDMLAPMGITRAVKGLISPLSKLLGPTAAERKVADLNALRGEGRMEKELAGIEAERLSSQASREAQTGKEAIARDVGTQSRKLSQEQTGAQDRAGRLFNEQKKQIEAARQAELAKTSRTAPERFQEEAMPSPPPPRSAEQPRIDSNGKTFTDAQGPTAPEVRSNGKTYGPGADLNDTAVMHKMALQELNKGRAKGGWDPEQISSVPSNVSDFGGYRPFPNDPSKDVIRTTHQQAWDDAKKLYPEIEFSDANKIIAVQTPAGTGRMTVEQLSGILEPDVLKSQLRHLQGNEEQANIFAQAAAGKKSTLTDLLPSKTPNETTEVARETPRVTKQQFGQQYKETIYPREKNALKKVFNNRYEEVRGALGDRQFPVSNRQAAEEAVLGEVGITRATLSTLPERTAEKVQRIEASNTPLGGGTGANLVLGGVKPGRDMVGMEVETSNMRRMVAELLQKERMGQRGDATAVLNEVISRNTGNNETLADMIANRQRIRMAHRAASDAGHDSVARQFGIIEDGITSDIEAATKAAGRDDLLQALRQTDIDYGKHYAPLYANKKAIPRQTANLPDKSVVDAIIRPDSSPGAVDAIQRGFEVIKNPAERQQLVGAWFKNGIEAAIDSNGEWSRDLFLKWVNKYRSPGTEDAVLKTAFGQNYDKFNEMVRTMQEAQPKAINDLAKETVGNLRSTKDAKIKAAGEDFGGRRKALESAGAEQVKQLNKGASDKTAAAELSRGRAEKEIQKSLDEAVAKLAGTNGNKLNMMQRVGAYKMIGALGIVPTTVAFGGNTTQILASAVAGGSILLAPMAWNKFMQSRKGMDLLIQGMRLAPGTTEAVQWAAQTNNFARQLQSGRQPKDQDVSPIRPPDLRPEPPPLEE